MNWEDMPDYAALWLQYCTRVGYMDFIPWLKRYHPDVEPNAYMQDRAAQMHEVVLVKGMEVIEREAK